MNTYRWAPGTALRLTAQTVGEELETLREQYDGVLTPQAIVTSARPDGSPLHDAFTWDDSEAARRWREEQARYMTRHLLIVYQKDDQEHTVRAYTNVTIKAERQPELALQTGQTRRLAFSVPTEDDGDEDRLRGYVHIADAMANADLRRQILERALQEIASWRRRYAEYDVFGQLFNEIDNLRLPLTFVEVTPA